MGDTMGKSVAVVGGDVGIVAPYQPDITRAKTCE
jgi:hypothetical protein